MNELISTAATMTSLEIADMVESRHDKVKQSIERLASRNVIQLPPVGIVENKQSLSPNNKTQSYIFSGDQGKRDSIVVVAQLSPEFTARLVDRWQELESGVKPKTRGEMILEQAQMLVDLEREQARIAAEQETIKAQVQALMNGEDYLTVVGYANIHKLRFDTATTAHIGKIATRICKANGYAMGRASHPVYGYINSYPAEVLGQVIDSFMETLNDSGE